MSATSTIPLATQPAPPQVDWQNDPDFHALPLAEKNKVLLKVDPQYAGLPPQEQSKALNVIHYGQGGTQFEQERAPDTQGFLSKAADVVGRQIKSAVTAPFTGVKEAYDTYNQSREAGGAVLPSLGRAAAPLALGAADPLGIARGMAQSTIDTATGGYQKRREQGYNPVYSAVAPTVAGAVNVNLPQMEEEARLGHTAGVAAEGAVPAAEFGAGEAMRIPAIGRAVEPIVRAARSPIETFAPRLAVPEAQKALTQAIQPGVNIPRAQESISIAGPRLQQLRQAGQITNAAGESLTEFKSPADLLEGVKSAKGHVWDAIEGRLGPVADLKPDTSPIADAMEKSISKRTEAQYPALAQRIRDRATTYRANMSLRDIENAIQDANDDLRNFYKRQSPTDSPISADTAATEAEVKAARSLLDQKVEQLRGAGVSDLKREYGALRDVEKSAARANAVATRQKGATLWEGLAALRAAGDFASGNVLGAAKGASTLAVGRWLAKLRDPNFLINEAFQGNRGKSFQPASAIETPPMREPRGLLGAGPTPFGAAPDTSGAADLGEPFTHPGTTPVNRGRLLGRGPLVTPPPGGYSSAVFGENQPGAYEAPRTSVRGEGGQFERGYISGIGPQQKGIQQGQIARIGDERWLWSGGKWSRIP